MPSKARPARPGAIYRVARMREFLARASNLHASPTPVMTTPPRLSVARSDTPAGNIRENDRRLLPNAHNRHTAARKAVARELPARLEQRFSTSPETTALSRAVFTKK